MVGAGGFEPPTSCSQSRRDARLRYAPNRQFKYEVSSPSHRLYATERVRQPPLDKINADKPQYSYHVFRSESTGSLRAKPAVLLLLPLLGSLRRNFGSLNYSKLFGKFTRRKKQNLQAVFLVFMDGAGPPEPAHLKFFRESIT